MIKHPRRAALALAALLLLSCSQPALALGDDPVLKRMDAVLEENARLRDEAWKARGRGKEAARQAGEAFEASETRLERARVEALAHVAGASPAQVEALRAEGKSWGQAAGEIGVHPGFLGIGKVPMYEPATARKAAKSAKALKAKRGRGKAAKEKAAVPKGGRKSTEKLAAGTKAKTKAKATPAKK